MTLITAITAILGAVGLLVLVLFRDVASDLAKQEARAWLPLLSRKIVRQSVESLSDEHRDILEDMESQLDERADRPITMLIFAIRVARDRRLIAAELRELAVEPSAARQRGSSISVRVPLLRALGSAKHVVATVSSLLNPTARRAVRWLRERSEQTLAALGIAMSLAVSLATITITGIWGVAVAPALDVWHVAASQPTYVLIVGATYAFLRLVSTCLRYLHRIRNYLERP